MPPSKVTFVPGIWKVSGINFNTELTRLFTLTVDGGYLEIELSLDKIVFVA